MTHISDLHNYCDDKAEAKAVEMIPDRNKDAIKTEIEELINVEFDRLEERAGDFISQTAASRAEKFLERILAGDEDAAQSLLGNTDGSRYRQSGHEVGKPWASVHHGKLFETGGIRQRRLIVEAHADLLYTERIKDLESIVEGLRLQITELHKQRDTRF